MILAAGTGNPFFTTDTCAALRASRRSGADVLLKATKVDGIYDGRSEEAPRPPRCTTTLSYDRALSDKLGVMDLTAFALAFGAEAAAGACSTSRRRGTSPGWSGASASGPRSTRSDGVTTFGISNQ